MLAQAGDLQAMAQRVVAAILSRRGIPPAAVNLTSSGSSAPAAEADLQAMTARIVAMLGPAPAVTTPPATGKPTLTWRQKYPIGTNSKFVIAVGYFVPGGTVGPYLVGINDPSGKYRLNVDSNGFVLRTSEVPVGAATDTLTAYVIDGRGKQSDLISFTVLKSDQDGAGINTPLSLPAFAPIWNGVLRPDAAPLFAVGAFGPSHADTRQDAVNVQGAGGWVGSGGAIYHPSGLPAVGQYPLSVTVTNKASQVATTFSETLTIVPVPDPAVEATQTATWSTATAPGTEIGIACATVPDNAPQFSIASPFVRIDPVTRKIITVANPSAPGDVGFVLNLASGGTAITKAVPVTFKMVQGRSIDPSAMAFKPSASLDNATPGLHVGDVQIDPALFTAGKPSFRISYQTRYCKAAQDASPSYGPRLAVSATGSIDCAPDVLLSEAKLGDFYHPADRFTVVASDGVNVCIQSFTLEVPRAAVTTHYYVGKADPATVGQGVPATAIRLADMAAMRAACMGAHRDYKVFWIEDGTDPDLYANQNNRDNNYALRFAYQGPGEIRWLGEDTPGHVEETAHLGGLEADNRPGGGDMRGKGALVLGDGDWTLYGLKVADTIGSDSTHGLEAVRRDGETVGDTVLIGCDLPRNNQGFETGLSHGRHVLDRSVLRESGTAHVSTGACHNAYIGAAWWVTARGCKSFGATLGHLFKSRAETTEITDCFFFDGLVGSSSCCVDIPSGGTLIFQRNFIEKGAMAMNPYALQYGAEGIIHAVNSWLIEDNTFSILTMDGNHFGTPAAIGLWPATVNGAPVTGTIRNNRFYASPKSRSAFAVVAGTNPVQVVAATGTTALSTPPLLDLAAPWFAGALPPPNPLYFHGLWGQDYYRNFEGVQHVPDGYEIVVSRSDKAGKTLRAIYAAADLDAPAKFGAGTTAALVRDPVYYAAQLPDPWAPDGLFLVSSSPNGQATLSLGVDGSALPADSTLYVQLRMTGPDGTKADNRYPIKVAA